MRNISSSSLSTLMQKTGTEPVIIIEVDWFNSNQSATIGPVSKYSDRSFSELGLDGRILQVADIEDILNVSRNGTSQSVTLTLDDTDGTLKNIFNNTDIHKKRVWIYQWFSGIPITDKFLLFSGIIASPISWKEGDRTLSFTVISKGEDKEVGFSPEEGEFPTLPQNMVGTVWPLVFGQVTKLPFQRVDDITYRAGGLSSNGGRSEDQDNGSNANPVTKEGTGIADPAIKPQLDLAASQAGEANRLAELYFLGYLQASGRARRAGELGEFAAIQTGKGPWSSLAKQYLDAGNRMLLEGQKLRIKSKELTNVQQKQKSYQKPSIGVTYGEKMPQGRKMTVNLGGAAHSGYFLGNQFVITGREHPDAEKFEGISFDGVTEPTINRETFFWADAGTPLDFNFNRPIRTETGSDGETIVVEENIPYPIRYVVSSTIPTTVSAVFARRTLGNVTGIYPVPPNYYEVIQTTFGTLPVTAIICRLPLSARNEGWDDELWGVVTSTIGPNTVDIIRWLIETYTTHQVDATSFAEVRALIDAYPSNFALMDRPQIMNVVADIAYQARCIIWLKDNTFYLKYLPKKDAPVQTITEADIIEQTLEVSYTESEDLTTKYIAEWVSQYKNGKKNLVILRYNINYYGTHERRYNYYIYTQQQLVEKSATFWLIREANTFKQVTMKVPIKFLNIETLDTITLNFSHSYIANGSVDCVVEEAVVDTEDYTIRLKCWVPVRAGEMETYTFAYLNDLQVQNIFPTDEDVRTRRAGGGRSDFNDHVKLPTRPVVTNPTNPSNAEILSTPFSGAEGNGGQLHVTVRPHTWGADPSYIPDSGNTTPTITQRVDTTGITPLGKKPDGTTKYQFDKAKLPEIAIVQPSSSTAPGTVVSGEGEGPYIVNVFFNGLSNNPTVIKEVFCVSLPDDDETPQVIPEGTAVMVTQLVYTDNSGNGVIEYSMQPAVWL